MMIDLGIIEVDGQGKTFSVLPHFGKTAPPEVIPSFTSPLLCVPYSSASTVPQHTLLRLSKIRTITKSQNIAKDNHHHHPLFFSFKK
jgi:hypothetical protein